MLAMMGMLAGIDYLSKVYSSSAESGDRFIETVKDLCNINNDDSEAMYQFRCALVHSVGLSVVSTRSRYRKGAQFNFEVTDEQSAPLIQKLADISTELKYRISYWELKKTFLKVTNEIENIARQVNHHKNSHVVKMIGQMHIEKLLKR